MRKRRKGVPFNPFNQKEVGKRKSEKSKKNKKVQKAAEERARQQEEKEKEIAWQKRVAEARRLNEKKEREEKKRLEAVERENKRFRSPSVGADFYRRICEEKVTKLSGFEKLIVLSILRFRENIEEYNGLGLMINYLHAHVKNDKEKKKQLEEYLNLPHMMMNLNYIQGTPIHGEPPLLISSKEELLSLLGVIQYHHKNCPIKGITPEPMGDTKTCRICETITKAIQLLSEAKYV